MIIKNFRKNSKTNQSSTLTALEWPCITFAYIFHTLFTNFIYTRYFLFHLKFILKKYQALHEQFKSAIVSQNFDELLLGGASGERPDFSAELSSFAFDSQIPIINARITNYTKISKIKQLKSSMVDKFICLNGTVSRISNTKPFMTRLAFECKSCHSTFVIL